MTFHVGQKVVCIDAYNTVSFEFKNGWIIEDVWRELVEGRVYTVRWFGIEEGEAAVKVCGVERHHSGDMSFAASRFRPAVEPGTDISIFTEMLKPSDEKVDA